MEVLEKCYCGNRKVLGAKKNDWFDAVCKQLKEEKRKARMRWLALGKGNDYEDYRWQGGKQQE